MPTNNDTLNPMNVSHLTVVPKFKYYDLKKMARNIPAAKGKSLKGIIDRHIFIMSCITDLKLAKSLVKTLNKSIEKELDSANDGETSQSVNHFFSPIFQHSLLQSWWVYASRRRNGLLEHELTLSHQRFARAIGEHTVHIHLEVLLD